MFWEGYSKRVREHFREENSSLGKFKEFNFHLAILFPKIFGHYNFQLVYLNRSIFCRGEKKNSLNTLRALQGT